jgi:hypothetical protein
VFARPRVEILLRSFVQIFKTSKQKYFVISAARKIVAPVDNPVDNRLAWFTIDISILQHTEKFRRTPALNDSDNLSKNRCEGFGRLFQ